MKALPTETPSLLRALWRQTLTSILFGTFSAAVIARARLSSKNDDGEERQERSQMLKNQQTSIESRLAVLAEDETSGARQILLVSLAIVGTALQNDCIVVALRFASSSAGRWWPKKCRRFVRRSESPLFLSYTPFDQTAFA